MTEYGPLYDTATLLLDVVTAAYAASGDPDADPPIPPAELPGRQYVVPGIVAAYDCEQVTVTVIAVGVGIPGQAIGVPIANCMPTRYATYRVEVIRDVPVVDSQGNPPKATALDASAKDLLRDMALLHGALLDARRRIASRGDTSDPVAGVGVPVAISNATPVGSDGGVAGSRIDIDVPF